jgi:predicted DsbA family dithiol-disulfide isomerase
MTLEQLFRGRSIDVEGMMVRLRRVAEEEGLPFGNRSMTYNSRLAQELGKWAECQGRGGAYHNTLFRAYFVDGRNIGKPSELVRLAYSIGLSDEEAYKIINSRAFREAVDEDWSRSRQLGITAVPTFVLNGSTVVGAQPYPVLETFLTENGIQPRTIFTS